MANNTPYMNLALPTEGGDAGVWDSELNQALTVVDSHNHTPGMGQLVPTAGLDIDSDLTVNNHKITDVQAVKFESLTTAPTGSTNSNQGEVVNGDLWFTNGSGTAVQITNGPALASTATSNTPAGIVLPYAGIIAPSGYLIADGTAISRTTYSSLFTVIGTLYGVGDGTTTFNIPNMSGRTAVAAGTYTDPASGTVTRSLSAALGEEKHVITQAELAAHTHIQDTHDHYGITIDGFIGGAGVGAVLGGAPSSPVFTPGSFQITNGGNYYPPRSGPTTANNQTTGSSTAHNNMQPSLVLNYIIKT